MQGFNLIYVLISSAAPGSLNISKNIWVTGSECLTTVINKHLNKDRQCFLSL